MNGIKKIHTEMRRKIAESFGTFDQPRFRILLDSLRSNLTLREQKEARDMYDILNALEFNGTISPGKYSVLIDIMVGFDQDMKGTLEKAEMDIQTLLTHGETTWVSKYERKSHQTGFVFYNTVKDAEGSLNIPVIDFKKQREQFLKATISKISKGEVDWIRNLKNFFEERLSFKCQDMSLGDQEKTANQLKLVHDNFCYVLFVVINDADKETFESVGETFKDVKGIPKIYINISTNQDVNGWVPSVLDADMLIANVTTNGGDANTNVQLLTKVLTSCHHKQHFEEMLVSVRNSIAKSEPHSAIPFSVSTLTQLLYLETGQQKADTENAKVSDSTVFNNEQNSLPYILVVGYES